MCVPQRDRQLHVLPGAPEKLARIISAPSQKQLADKRRSGACRGPALSADACGRAHKLAGKVLAERESEKRPNKMCLHDWKAAELEAFWMRSSKDLDGNVLFHQS